MIQASTVLNVADNSGILIAKCIHVNGHTGNFFAHVGDIVVLSAKKVSPKSQFKKGDIHYGVVVRTKSQIKRKDGSFISFSDNAVVILDKKSFEPVGTSIFGPVPREIRANKLFSKIISLAKEVL